MELALYAPIAFRTHRDITLTFFHYTTNTLTNLDVYIVLQDLKCDDKSKPLQFPQIDYGRIFLKQSS